jgi:WD40 repeat protein
MNMMASTNYCDVCGASNPSQATHCFVCNTALQRPSLSPLSDVQATPLNAAALEGKDVGPLSPSYLLHSRYSIDSQVGTGGFGAVYKAKDTLFSHRLVAIKEMNQDGLSSRELTEATTAFEHEAFLLSQLTHPNLPRIHDYFSEHGRSYVVMDYIAGDTLEDYLDKVVQRLPIEMVLEIGIQLSTVLDYLHNHQPPIIFRDVKPANIMRTADNHVYLIDFGIARHFKPGKAKDTVPLGSKGYAAPEQYGKAQTTPQTDIYGLGATLHELLTGDDPSLSLFHFEPIRPGKKKVSPIISQLNTLLERMLEMQISKRPASMAIVKQELQRYLAQQLALTPSHTQSISQAQVKRRRFLIGLAGTLATCSLSSAIATLAFNNQNTLNALFAHPISGSTPVLSPVLPASEQARIISRPLYIYHRHNGSVTAVAWSPKAQIIASAGMLDSTVQIWDANTGNLFVIPGKNVYSVFPTNSLRVDALAWSPNSASVAAALNNDAVNIWSIETGHQRPFSLSQYPNVTDSNALAWSPDGIQIAAISKNSIVQICSATTGNISLYYTGHTQAVLTLAWSPDGKHIASGGADGTVRVWEATTGITSVTYSLHTAEINAIAWSPDSKHIASGGADSTVQVWDASTGLPLFTYLGHSGTVNAVAWPSGPQLFTGLSRIASGGDDSTVQVWSFGRANTMRHRQALALQGELLIYRGHTGPVTSVTWAPDGQHIASGSEDGTVQVWQAT